MIIELKIQKIVLGIALLLILTCGISCANANDTSFVSNNNSAAPNNSIQQQIPTISSNPTLISDDTGKAKLAAIEPILSYKANMTYWQKKISSDLLQIVDPDYPLGVTTVSQQKQLLRKFMQLIPADNVSTELNVSANPNQKFGDVVIVNIIIDQSASTDAIAPYTTKIIGFEKRTVLAWVDLNNIIDLAKRDDVTNIILVDRGVSYYQNELNTASHLINENLTIQSTISQTPPISNSNLTKISTTPSSSLSIFVIFSTLFVFGLIFVKIRKSNKMKKNF